MDKKKPIPFISIPSPIPGIGSGIELNSYSIPELIPTLVGANVCFQVLLKLS